MANKARGFVEFQLGEETLDICLGLGALAEIEDAFGVESFEQAPLFVGGRVSAKPLLRLLSALLKGNGIEVTPERSAALTRLQPAGVLSLMETLFVASGLSKDGRSAPAEDGSAPLEDASAGEPG